MTRLAVLGAGVVGSVYAALLAGAGNDVVLVARGRRLVQLREQGLRVDLDGVTVTPTVGLAEQLEDAHADVLLVAVRADQLADGLEQIAGC